MGQFVSPFDMHLDKYSAQFINGQFTPQYTDSLPPKQMCGHWDVPDKRYDAFTDATSQALERIARRNHKSSSTSTIMSRTTHLTTTLHNHQPTQPATRSRRRAATAKKEKISIRQP
ncbi:uncharacterized protein BDZ99DRAFT_212187 [Mytilinidion resinicola]|uniref:Uncharacterized protein n=1 Tax=Mytilinidion resinicola TaxID=574789 RepID=A0A6A6XZJ0_9PEZI|nr:uncharacterized protein BDZ99DRAFT_212187 [Mytilinidion resinicola]KAF2801986.1 hypothetical protein BDZ99DRAFT_212187 [Mytilinidion resinicola]